MSNFFLKMLGNLHFSKFPMFITVQPQYHKIKGWQQRKVLNNLEPGDILVRRFDGYLSSMWIPGFWKHAALYLGNNEIAHAIASGVHREDILDFLRCDHVAIMRLDSSCYDTSLIYKAIDYAKRQIKVGVKYDFSFKDDNGKYYCTEFVNACFDDLFHDNFTTITNKKSFLPIRFLLPDNLYVSKNVTIILTIDNKK